MPNPQDLSGMMQAGSFYAPLATGVQHQPQFGFEGTPFGGFMPGMLASPFLRHGMGQVGMMPMGVAHDQNVYDSMRNMQLTQAQFHAMQLAAQGDRGNFLRTMRGAAAAVGVPWDTRQRMLAGSAADAMVTAAPMAAMFFPELVDQLGGARGSGAVLASRVFDAGRYRIDPITGQMGMGDRSSAMTASLIMKDMFSDQNLPNMQGFRAGQVGGMFQALQQRGMIAGQGASATQFSGEALDKMNLDAGTQDKLRAFDADRVKRSISNYTKALAAMRDIFGDSGHPNAPIPELVNALEALTNGSLSQLDPNQVSGLARKTYNLSRQTGVTLNTAMMMQQHASSRAAQMGLEPVFGVQAMQGGLGFGGAFRGQGHGAFAAWGAMSADQIQQLDMNLRVQASGSNMANRAGMAMRMRDTAGGFEKGSAAERYTSAISAGLNQFEYAPGQFRSVNLSDQEFVQMMQGAKNANGRSLGLTEGSVREMLMQQHENREFGFRYGVQDIVRREQANEVYGFIGKQFQNVMTSQLANAGADRGRAGVAAEAIQGRVMDRIRGLSTETISNRQSRNAAISQIIEAEMHVAGQGDLLNNMPNKNEFLTTTAERFYGQANRALAGSAYSAFGNIQNVHRTMNQNVLDAADRQQMQARHTADMQEALSPLTPGSLLTNAVNALQRTDIRNVNAVQKIISRTLGGVDVRDIANGGFLPALEKHQAARTEVEKLQARIMNTKDPGERARLQQQLEEANKELNAQSIALAGLGKDFLSSTGELASEEQARKSLGLKDPTDKQIMDERRRLGNVLEAGRLLGTDPNLSLDKMPAAQRKQFDATVEDVSRSRRITAEQHGQITKYRTAVDTFDRYAKSIGLTSDELKKAASNQDIGKAVKAEHLDFARKVLDQIESGGKDVEGVARSIGLGSKDDLIGKGGLLTRLEDLNREAYNREQGRPLEEVFKGFGIEMKPGDESVAKISGMTQDPLGAAVMSRISGTQNVLAGIAKTGGSDAKTLMSEYRAARGDSAKWAEFRKKYGLTGLEGADKMTDLQRAASFTEHMEKLNKGGPIDSSEKLANVYGELMKEAKQAARGGHGGMPSEMTLKGTLYVTGDQAKIDANGRGDVVPGER